NNELLFENLMVTQVERCETMGNPAQSFSRCMWLRRTRIGGANDIAEERQRRVCDTIFLEDRVERNILAMMAELAIRHVEDSAIFYFCPISFLGEKYKFRLGIDALPD